MSKVTCSVCGTSADARSMQVCNMCQSYVCSRCSLEHRDNCGWDQDDWS